MEIESYLYYHKECGIKEDKKLRQLFPLIDFSGIKSKTDIQEGFCCNKAKIEFNDYRNKSTVPALATLDQSMNYSKHFIRENGNEGTFIKNDFTYKVNGLWDYKAPELIEFKQAYNKHFGNIDWFELHDRYNIDIKLNLEFKIIYKKIQK